MGLFVLYVSILVMFLFYILKMYKQKLVFLFLEKPETFCFLWKQPFLSK